ncbi:MAG: hypothetical protein JNG90_20140 [Planctomycetaceae bacterium]|nr:hypothetical protein [Planctomycetaceae bacterium]
MIDTPEGAEELLNAEALRGQIAANRNRNEAAMILAAVNGLGIATILVLIFCFFNQPHYHDGADPSALLLALVPAMGVMCLSPICIFLGVQSLRYGNRAVEISSLGSAIAGTILVLWIANAFGFI